jgi:hypothetical protein
VRATAGSLPSALVRRLLCVSRSDLDEESDHDRKWNASRAESMLACPGKCFWERISRITCVDYSNRKGMVMQTIRVGLGRLYNASACSNLRRDEILLPFPLGSIEVRAYIGPNPQHIIGTWTVGSPQPQDPACFRTDCRSGFIAVFDRCALRHYGERISFSSLCRHGVSSTCLISH